VPEDVESLVSEEKLKGCANDIAKNMPIAV
jgi:hypothetical protein